MDILIVEDGATERERLLRLFLDAGYSVTACESVAEAEASMTGVPVRLLLLDIGLNDKSGSYLFSKIRHTDQVEHCIIFTGNPSAHLRERFLAEGAADYIVKGSREATAALLLQRISELLGAPASATLVPVGLREFLDQYIPQRSHSLFVTSEGDFPVCEVCGTNEYVVDFSGTPQMPPDIQGVVRCRSCNTLLDPTIG